jgi:hypothetical protein
MTTARDAAEVMALAHQLSQVQRQAEQMIERLRRERDCERLAHERTAWVVRKLAKLVDDLANTPADEFYQVGDHMAGRVNDTWVSKNQVLEYAKLLAEHDWLFEHSEDHTVWERGNKAFGEIRRLRQLVDHDYELWNMHCPMGMRQPAAEWTPGEPR